MFKNSELIRVLKFMKNKLPFYLFLTIIISFIQGVFLNLVLAFIMKDAINAATSKEWLLLNRAIIIGVVSLAIGVLILPFLSYFNKKIRVQVMAKIRVLVFQHMEKLSVETFDKKHSGEIVSTLTNDVNTIEAIYGTQLQMLSFTIVYGIATMGAVFTLEWKLALLIFVFGVISIMINHRFSQPLRNSTNLIQENKSFFTKRLIDVLDGVKTTKIFGIEEDIFIQLKETNDKLVETKNTKAKLDASLSSIDTFYTIFRYLVILVIGLAMVMNSMIDVGSIAAIVILQGNANFFFDNIGHFISGTKSQLAGASRVLRFLDEKVENDLNQDLIESETIKMEDPIISLKNVEFSYGENLTLQQIEMEADLGKVTALVGPSGGGKSTILKLLMRFYRAQKGTLKIQGKDVSNYTLKELRDLTAYVPQDAYLFTGTIADNIRYGKENATMDEVMEAAKMAYADEFIMEKENGYDTIVGEKGDSLSGGQKQRIAIARAILKNAPILLLDEATSALDSDSEQIVQKALNVLMQGRTTIVVAHRLSTIQNADMIYVVDGGRIIEKGKHDVLLENKGLYHKLYQLNLL